MSYAIFHIQYYSKYISILFLSQDSRWHDGKRSAQAGPKRNKEPGGEADQPNRQDSQSDDRV